MPIVKEGDKIFSKSGSDFSKEEIEK